MDGLLDLVNEVNLPSKVLELLYDRLAKIEQRLAIGCSEKMQSLELISTFIQARDLAFDNFTDARMEL